MRHPSDSPGWMTFDHNHKDFSADPRNVRLGLASDGMNHFKTLSDGDINLIRNDIEDITIDTVVSTGTNDMGEEEEP
uniref:Uncharacterized protein n=1 Tax=Cannabis sativa TaxID=3483 RepID=A0A803P505_CANSA